MIAIWPVGPPKLMKPSFSQNRSASANGIMLRRGHAGVPSAFHWNDRYLHAVEALHRIGPDDVLRRADLERPPLAEQEGALRDGKRLVGVMAREEDRDSAGSEGGDPMQHADLVAEVE